MATYKERYERHVNGIYEEIEKRIPECEKMAEEYKEVHGSLKGFDCTVEIRSHFLANEIMPIVKKKYPKVTLASQCGYWFHWWNLLDPKDTSGQPGSTCHFSLVKELKTKYY